MKVRPRIPSLLPTIAAVLGLAITLSAAYWQFGRASYKASRQQDYQQRQSEKPVSLNAAGAVAAGFVEFRKLTASGRFLSEHTIFLDNRTRDGIAGYEVVTPLRLSNGTGLVLINRGWVRAGRERSDLPRVDTPDGEVLVTGTAVEPTSRILELSGQTIQGKVWQNLVLSRYREVHGLNVMDFVIQQEDELNDGLLRRWSPPGFGVRTHQSYAAQWLIFASLIVIFYVYYGYIRREPDKSPSQ